MPLMYKSGIKIVTEMDSERQTIHLKHATYQPVLYLTIQTVTTTTLLCIPITKKSVMGLTTIAMVKLMKVLKTLTI